MRRGYHDAMSDLHATTSGMGLFNWKDTVRRILSELHAEIVKVEAERDLASAKVLRIVFGVVQRTLLPEG
jgi:hypothetical protein